MNRAALFAACVFAIAVVTLPGRATRAAEPDAEGIAFFEKKIRPVLVEHCHKCHSADSKPLQGGLRLDHRDGTRKGGESGPAIVPGKPADSLIVDALKYDGLQMPPKGRLPETVVADFMKWIEMGAPDPRAIGENSRNETGVIKTDRGDEVNFSPVSDMSSTVQTSRAKIKGLFHRILARPTKLLFIVPQSPVSNP